MAILQERLLPPEPWVSINISNLDSAQASLGDDPVLRFGGLVLATVHVPAGEGTKEARAFADRLPDVAGPGAEHPVPSDLAELPLQRVHAGLVARHAVGHDDRELRVDQPLRGFGQCAAVAHGRDAARQFRDLQRGVVHAVFLQLDVGHQRGEEGRRPQGRHEQAVEPRVRLIGQDPQRMIGDERRRRGRGAAGVGLAASAAAEGC